MTQKTNLECIPMWQCEWISFIKLTNIFYKSFLVSSLSSLLEFSTEDVKIVSERLQIFPLFSAKRVMEQWGFFSVSPLQWQGHVFLRSSGDPWHSSNGNVTTSFNDLLLTAAVTWVLNRTVLMQGTVINILYLKSMYYV